MPTTPNDIAGLVSWYFADPAYCFSDADGTIPCAAGDLVYVWNDRKGSNNLTQATSPLRPTYRDDGNYRYVDFDGTQYMDYAGGVVTAAPLSFALWAYLVSGAPTPLSVSVSGSNNSQFRLTSSTVSGVQATAVSGFGAGATASTGAGAIQPTGAWAHVVAAFTSASSRAAYLNGGNKGSNALPVTPVAATINLTRLGARNNATAFLTGRVAEVAIWSAAITDQNVADLYAAYGAGIPPTLDVPQISGTPAAPTGPTAVGGTLTAATPTVTGGGTITYAYLWQHGDGSAAAGTATNSTYVTQAGDAGFTMTVRYTPTNAAGTGATATSSPTAAVTAASSGSSVPTLQLLTLMGQ